MLMQKGDYDYFFLPEASIFYIKSKSDDKVIFSFMISDSSLNNYISQLRQLSHLINSNQNSVRINDIFQPIQILYKMFCEFKILNDNKNCQLINKILFLKSILQFLESYLSNECSLRKINNVKELFIALKKFIEKTNNQINMNTVFENIDDIFNTINSITELIQFNNDKIVDNTIYNNQIENIKYKFTALISCIQDLLNKSTLTITCLAKDFFNYQINPSYYCKILLKIAKYQIKHESSAIIHIFQSLLEYYEIRHTISSADEIKIKSMLNEIQEKGDFYLIDFLVHIVLKKLFDQNLIILKFHKKLKEDDKIFINTQHPAQFNEINTSYELYFERYLYFIKVKQEVQSREKRIMTQNYSKFIVQVTEQKEENLYIPYYPNGTLFFILNERSEKRIELSFIDKIIMIIEIATAMKDLHSHDEYHGNLSSQSIFINSTKDAYLGLFCYDLSLEAKFTISQGNDQNNSVLNIPYFYRPSEDLKYVSDNNDKKKRKLIDLYSFGILMYEIFTHVSPEKLIGKNGRHELFKEDSSVNEIFKDDFIDDRGDSLSGMKEIIEKCMKTETTERYSSFKELIECIEALPIYTNNKEEIEFRLKHAIDASEYQCTISDLVESYYRGQTASKDIIEKFLKEASLLFNENFERGEDIIKSTFSIFSSLIENDQSFIFKDILCFLEKAVIIPKHSEKLIENEFLLLSIDQQKLKSLLLNYNVDLEKNQFFDKFEEFFTFRTNESVQANLDHLFNRRKNYHLDYILRVIIKLILDTDSLLQYVDLSHYGSDEYFDVRSIMMNDKNASYKLMFDKNLSFIMEKVYLTDIDCNCKEREQRILKNCCSKFIACSRDTGDYKTTIPYFPNGSLDKLFSISIDEQTINLTMIDKIVIIVEVATALNDLHTKKEFHGNLSSQSIYINGSKDAYIGSFCHDRKKEDNESKVAGPLYYRPPEIFENNTSDDSKNEDDEEFLEQQRNIDIYSLGVLMHEILTEVSPESRFGNRTRQNRWEILKGECKIENQKYADNFKNYSDFLFKEGGGNEVFEDNYKDEEGNSFAGMKEIIEKCMKTETTERYSSFKELIGCIEALPIYTNNKEEIEFRLKHAIDAREYQCTISDLVESCSRGQTDSKNNIDKFLLKYLEISNRSVSQTKQFLSDNAQCSSQDDNKTVQITENVIQKIFDAFGKKFEEDYSQYFEDIFNLIINLSYNKKLNKNQSVVDEEDYLLKLSREANLDEEEGREIIIPVCSLGSFIDKNKNRVEEGDSLIFLYFIAKDLSLIHSNNLYHGELRADHIGLYYNHETRTLIPSVILYYYYYKNNQNSNMLGNKSSSYESLCRQQRKDIKNFIKIAVKLGISDEILSIIQESETMDVIVSYLYNFIKRNSNKKQHEIFERNYSRCEYSSFVITYPVIEEVFHHIEDNDYSFEGLTIDFENIYQMMNGLLDNIESHPENSIKDNLPPFITSTNTTQEAERIADLIENIKSKCKILYTEINGNKPKEESSSLIIDMDMNFITIRQVKDNNSPDIDRL